MISKQAALSKVIWSEVEREVNPGSFLANSTIFMIPLEESSVTLSHNIDFPFPSLFSSCKWKFSKL